MENAIIMSAFVIVPVAILLISIITGLKRNAFQSGFKLTFTVLAIVISGIFAKTVAQVLVDTLLSQSGLIDPNVLSYLTTANSAKDIIGIVKALIMPIVFVALFIVIKTIFFLLNLIPRFALSDKAIMRRQTAKNAVAIPDAEAIYSDTYSEEELLIATKYAPYKTKARKSFSKFFSVICCVLSAILVLASLALPINAYAKYATTVFEESENLLELDSDLEYAKNIINTIDSHPTNICYTYVNNLTIHSFETFDNHKGTTVSLSDALHSSLSIVNNVSSWDINSISAQNIYDLADLIENDPFAKDFVTSFVGELCDAWARGESYLGIAPPDLDNPLMVAILNELSSMDDIVKVLRAVADILKMTNALQFNLEDFTFDSVSLIAKELFNTITPDTVDFIKSMISEETLSQFIELPPSVAGHVSEFTGFVLDGIVELKNNPDFSIDQTIDMIEQEAEALSAIIEIVSNPENVEPEKIVETIIESEVISNTIQKVTDSGVVSDPYQIADMIPQEFTDQVKETLKEHDIPSDNEVYKSIMALISK